MCSINRLHMLCCLSLALPPMVVHAQAASEQEGMLYLESVAMPKRASVCAARFAGYSAKFEPLFAKWSASNQPRLVAGKAFLRAEAAKANQNFTFHAEAVAIIDAQLLEKATPEILEENCDALLQRVASGA